MTARAERLWPDKLRLGVEDDGPGMDARTLARATDDFFTTRVEGSGLGLSFARRVAEAHGGWLRVHSTLGEGTLIELGFRG